MFASPLAGRIDPDKVQKIEGADVPVNMVKIFTSASLSSLTQTAAPRIL